MIFRPAVFRWYQLLPVILAASALPITTGAQINQIARDPEEDHQNTPAAGQHGTLAGRLDRGLNLEYQTDHQPPTTKRNDRHILSRRETIVAGEPDRPSVTYTSRPLNQSERGLNLEYHAESRKKLSRKPETYALFEHEKQMDVTLATGKSRQAAQQKTRTFDFYSDTEKTPARKKTILENDEDAPIILKAEQITGRPDREMNMDYLVEVEKGQTRITGDHAVFRQQENEVEVIGSVDITRYGDRYRSESTQFNMDTGEGVLNHARYRLDMTGGQGRAERIDLEDEHNSTIINGTYTICEGENPDWYLSTETLNLDTARNIGQSKYPVLYFKNVPILAATSMSFPLSSERKSGFLPPTIGATSKGGMELMAPYYFNLAPNYDLTIYPKYIAKRGFQLGGHGRYLGNTYKGETYIEYLPSDNEAGRDRYAISSQHEHDFAPGWKYAWDFNKASDDNYPDDFSSPITSGNRLLLQDGYLSYSHTYWNITAGASRYQVLQDKELPITPSYDRLPYVNINTHAYDIKGFDFTTNLQYTRFWLSDDKLLGRQRGTRYVAKPEISFPIISSGYFLTPKASVHYASYDLDDANLQRGQDRTMSRAIPTVSLDGGLIFERDASFFGTDMTQTLEPRLFYVYTPYRNQNKYPVFDSGEPSFGYAQLFEENRFVGEDRISDANNLTAAITSRFIEQSGAERMRFTVGQRYYFSDQRVALYSPIEKRNENRSDLLLMASGLLTPKLAVDTSVQYNQSTRRTYSANYSLQWRPADKKVLNAEYRYLRNSIDEYGNAIDQINISGQWPLGKRWYAVGQVSYSLPDSKTIESLFGVEYNADCWIGRIVAQRYATSSTESNTALFFQLELKGMSKIGSNPMEVLRKGIPGYRPLTAYDE
ncbi:LPS-assembly protein LptD [Oxalobacter sp. OttesenSCG-928-P03]|nr:LPS-assembly protein LptD [Oxalobacter sp. OttesenSCG-928-P03]